MRCKCSASEHSSGIEQAGEGGNVPIAKGVKRPCAHLSVNQAHEETCVSPMVEDRKARNQCSSEGMKVVG